MIHRTPRGQVLPMWALGIITTFGLMFLALNYANAVRWQIRAQNAADSAAAAIIAIQAERWNVMTATLYTSGVEEYRIRRLLDATLLTIDGAGGCTGTLYPTGSGNYRSNAAGSCHRIYGDVRNAYMRAVTRYGKDVSDLNNVAALSTFTGFKSDANKLLQTFQACSSAAVTSPSPGPSSTPTPMPSPSPSPTATAPAASSNPSCGDTAFKYSWAPYGPHQTTGVAGMQQQTGLNSVLADAQQWKIDYGAADAQENPEAFAPAQIDVVTCALVPAIVPNFGPIHFAPYYALGRAAAANVMVEQDWLEPGSVFDPQRGSAAPFQPDEPNTQPAQWMAGYNWYDVNFGGEQTTAYVNYGVFNSTISNDQFDARVGWWGGIPIRPFGGTVTLTGPQGAC